MEETNSLFYETNKKYQSELERLEKANVGVVEMQDTIVSQALEITKLKEENEHLKNANYADIKALENLQNAILNMCYHLEIFAINDVETIDKVIKYAKITPNQQELDILNFIRALIIDRANKKATMEAECDAYRG